MKITIMEWSNYRSIDLSNKPMIIIVLALLSIISLNGQWQRVAIPTSEKLYDIDMLNDQIIIGSYKGIFYSSNQGLNWNTINIDQGFDIPYDVLGVKFINSTYLVATGFFYEGNAQIVYRSTNLGNSWIRAYENISSVSPIRAIYGLDFATNEVGFAVGKNKV